MSVVCDQANYYDPGEIVTWWDNLAMDRQSPDMFII